jgi:hypothetical protein
MIKPRNLDTSRFWGAHMLNCGKIYEWHKLNPDLADNRAVWGLMGPKGSTFIITEDGRGLAIGLWSGIYTGNEEAFLQQVERECHSLDGCAPGMTDIDRRIKRSTFKSWILP